MTNIIEKIKSTTVKQRVVAGVIVIALAGVGIGVTVHNANVATAKQTKIQKEERLAADKAKKAKADKAEKAKQVQLKAEADKKAKEKAAADAKAKADKAVADKKAAEEQAAAKAQQEAALAAQAVEAPVVASDDTGYTGSYEPANGVYSESAASQPDYTPAQQAPAAPPAHGATPLDANADNISKDQWGGDMDQWAK
ncbi:hypothetical protein FACS1894193_04720 [Bacilli bacterium]|nr:hypothetical protein FACS1894192_07710 [Bacilli bacterium]GHU41225.1 hypothetical protein FACS1894193_04720 [Bacilli bacterium]